MILIAACGCGVIGSSGAFNRNMPYDQFIVQQIAGDLLPNPTQEQLIATGFNRNNRSVTEGGSIVEVAHRKLY
ncbi:MAG: DUF1549 domain-containing protein [Pirellulaceae bacterium]